MTAAVEGEPGTDAPLRRFFWAKWVSLAIVLVAAGVALSWRAWDARGRQALDAEVARWKQEGLPLTRDQFPRPAVRDEENGYALLTRALADADFSHPDIAGDVDNALATPWPDDVMAAAEETLTRNARMLDALRALPPRATAVWPWPKPGGVEWAPLRLGDSRRAANHLKLDAQVAAQLGDAGRLLDDARAAEAVRRYLHAGPALMPLLVADGIGALGNSIVYDYAYKLHFTGTARAKALDLIRLYLDDGDEPVQCERAFCAEVAYGMERSTGPGASRSWGARYVGPILRPMRMKNAARLLAEARAIIAAGRSGSWPTLSAASAAVASAPPPPAVRPEPAASIAATWTEDAWVNWRLYLTEYRAATARRMAAAVLACQLYAADHAGRCPPSLAVLVPAYLPAVPLDPFSPTRGPIGYRFDSTGRPFVYSVLQQGVDRVATGALAPTPATHDDWRLPMYVLFVEPPPPRGPATVPARHLALVVAARATTSPTRPPRTTPARSATTRSRPE